MSGQGACSSIDRIHEIMGFILSPEYTSWPHTSVISVLSGGRRIILGYIVHLKPIQATRDPVLKENKVSRCGDGSHNTDILGG